MAEFNTYHDTIDLSELRELCTSHGEMREYEKGEVFLAENEVCREIALVTEGYFRMSVHTSDGEERAIGFAFENDYICDVNGYLTKSPSGFAIIAGRRCSVYAISLDKFVEFALSKGMNFCVKFQIAIFRTVMTRYTDIYKLSARERYLKIQFAHPEMLQKISLRELASYLRITPVHLSRLRRELLK